MKSKFGFSEKVIVVLAVVAASQIWWFFKIRQTPEQKRSICTRNLNQIALAVLLYAQDADDKLPPLRVGAKRGWVDVIQPYLKKPGAFQCPAAEGTKPNSTDYFFNKRLSALSLDKIEDRAQVILIGDGDDDAPTWNSWAYLSSDSSGQISPALRHLGGTANYACVDGHVIRMAPQFIGPHSSSTSEQTTFSWRF